MRVAIAGAGGMGREALAWLRDARPEVDPVAFFVADATEHLENLGEALAIVDSLDGLAGLGVECAVLGIGDAVQRHTVAAELATATIRPLSVLHPMSFRGPRAEIAEGAIAAPHSTLSCDVVIGRCAIINIGATISHDVILGDFVSVGPRAVLAGNVRVDSEAFVGAGAVVLPGRRIGSQAIVGAGAVVTRDVESGSVVAGNPARNVC